MRSKIKIPRNLYIQLCDRLVNVRPSMAGDEDEAAVQWQRDVAAMVGVVVEGPDVRQEAENLYKGPKPPYTYAYAEPPSEKPWTFEEACRQQRLMDLAYENGFFDAPAWVKAIPERRARMWRERLEDGLRAAAEDGLRQ